MKQVSITELAKMMESEDAEEVSFADPSIQGDQKCDRIWLGIKVIDGFDKRLWLVDEWGGGCPSVVAQHEYLVDAILDTIDSPDADPDKYYVFLEVDPTD